MARSWGASGLLLVGFLLCTAPLLETLEYAFDEGVYIQQARLVLSGKLPYRDFFNHQTPLYVFILSAVASPAPDALWLYRLPSLLATALSGVAVHRIALRLTTPLGAFVSALLFFLVPLQYFDLVAMPNALMLATSICAFGLVWFGSRRAVVVCGALLFAFSILVKPIAISAALAAGLALATRRERWPDLLVATIVGGVAMAIAWALFDVLSEGAFTELLWLQATRHGEGGGFELLKQYKAVAGTVERQGISTVSMWNARNHAITFLAAPRINQIFPLAGLALAGQILIWTPLGASLREHRLALTFWWAVPLAFSIFVWDPSFQHYYVQYLPAFSIHASIFLVWLWDCPVERIGRIGRIGYVGTRALAVAAVAIAAVMGPWLIFERRNDYAQLTRPEEKGESWLLFDPFLNFVSGTRPACGLIDPFNVYGPVSLTAIGAQEIRGRFHLDREGLVACLEADPSIRIGLGYWSTWFMDAPLARYLASLPASRFLPMRLHYRPPGGGQMPPSPEEIRHGLPPLSRMNQRGQEFRVDSEVETGP